MLNRMISQSESFSPFLSVGAPDHAGILWATCTKKCPISCRRITGACQSQPRKLGRFALRTLLEDDRDLWLSLLLRRSSASTSSIVFLLICCLVCPVAGLASMLHSFVRCIAVCWLGVSFRPCAANSHKRVGEQVPVWQQPLTVWTSKWPLRFTRMPSTAQRILAASVAIKGFFAVSKGSHCLSQLFLRSFVHLNSPDTISAGISILPCRRRENIPRSA